MSFELLHFRGADKILKKKNMDHVVKATCDNIESVLYGTLHKGGLLRQALEEADWRQDPRATENSQWQEIRIQGLSEWNRDRRAILILRIYLGFSP